MTTEPSASIISSSRTCQPNVPSTWWFLPWMSLAMAPPTVTNRVPGVTGRNQPHGTHARSTTSRDVPAEAVTVPRCGSSSTSGAGSVSSIAVPPAFCAESP